MSETEVQGSLSPPQGAVKPYDEFLKLLETRSVPKVDKTFLKDHNIASGNEAKFMRGLRFLGLIDKEGNARTEMGSLSVVGEKRRENLERVVRQAYSLLFDMVKIDLERVDPDTLTNSFKTDYKMGSPATARQSAQIFVFLAQKAGMTLSQSIVEKLSVSQEKARKLSQIARQPKTPKTDKGIEPKTTEGVASVQLPQEALARFTVKDIGYVDIKDQDTFRIAQAYMKLLSKKLEIPAEESEN